jgi:hypothetical protein
MVTSIIFLKASWYKLTWVAQTFTENRKTKNRIME